MTYFDTVVNGMLPELGICKVHSTQSSPLFTSKRDCEIHCPKRGSTYVFEETNAIWDGFQQSHKNDEVAYVLHLKLHEITFFPRAHVRYIFIICANLKVRTWAR